MYKVEGSVYSNKKFQSDIYESMNEIKLLKEEQERVVKERLLEDCNREIRIATEEIRIAQFYYEALNEVAKIEGLSDHDRKVIKDLSDSIYSNMVNSQYYLGEIIDLPENQINTQTHIKLKNILKESFSFTDKLIERVKPYLNKYGYSVKSAPDGSQPGGEN